MTLYVVAGIIVLVLAAFLFVWWRARQSGEVAQSLQSSKEAADAAQKMADAEAGGPHSGDDALDRLSDGSG